MLRARRSPLNRNYFFQKIKFKLKKFTRTWRPLMTLKNEKLIFWSKKPPSILYIRTQYNLQLFTTQLTTQLYTTLTTQLRCSQNLAHLAHPAYLTLFPLTLTSQSPSANAVPAQILKAKTASPLKTLAHLGSAHITIFSFHLQQFRPSALIKKFKPALMK